MARTISRITGEMQLSQQTKHPGMRDYSPYSALTTFNEAIAIQVHFLELLNERKSEALSILTATGADLDRLVLDRLPEGRQPGTRSSGLLKFYRTSPAPAEFLIRAGSIVSAAAPAAPPVFFRTLKDTVLAEGAESVYVEAESDLPEARANVSAYSISTIVSSLPGIHSVLNELPFEGGTDFESDEDLRKRYIYAPRLTGRATKSLFLEHMAGVSGVLEAQAFQDGPGQLLVILDTSYALANQPAEIWDSIKKYLAAGVVAAGVHGATVGPSGAVTAIGDSYGGGVWGRPRGFVATGEAIRFTYLNWDNTSKSGSIYIPGGTRRGQAIQAVLAEPTDFAKVIQTVDYPGSNEYDLFIGLGVYPYLYTLPELVEVQARITVRLTSTPELNVRTNLESSITAALNSYKIGDDLEWSDMFGCLFKSKEDGHLFVGVDEIVSAEFSYFGQYAVKPGDKIVVEQDERIRAGTVNVEIVS